MHWCADGYDGWFGSAIGSVMAGSACEGRDEPVRELGIEARDLRVERRGVGVSQDARGLTLGPVVFDDELIGDEVLLTGVNGGVDVAHVCAIATCSGVRVSEIVRISASAARYAGEPNAGGGPGRI